MAKDDKYLEPIVMHFPNAIVRVHFPDISDEENARRYEIVKEKAAALLMSIRKKNKENSNDGTRTQGC